MQWKSMWILWNLHCSAFQQPSIHLHLRERLHRIAVWNRYPGVSRLYLQLIKGKLWLISLLNLHSYALDSFKVRVYQIHIPLDILVLIRQRRSMATIIDAQVLSTELFVLCPFLNFFHYCCIILASRILFGAYCPQNSKGFRSFIVAKILLSVTVLYSLDLTYF